MALKKEVTKKDLFIKYWFVLFVAVAFLVFIGIYSAEAYKNRTIYVNEKTEEGKYIIFSIDGKNYYADDLYEDSYSELAPTKLFDSFTRKLLDETIETTSDMKLLAKNYEAYYLQQSTSTQEELKDYLIKAGYSNGLDDSQAYYINYLKTVKALSDYLTNHYDEEVADYIKTNEYKAIYHILIKVAEVEEVTEDGTTTHVAKPTDEETSKLNAVLEALKTREFQDVAKEFSEDSSNEDGGFLGYVTKADAKENYVTEFADAVNTLESGVLSDVITTKYGYHIIVVYDPTKEEIITNMAEDSTIPLAIYESDSDVLIKALLELAQNIDYTITNEDLKNSLTIDEGEEE